MNLNPDNETKTLTLPLTEWSGAGLAPAPSSFGAGRYEVQYLLGEGGQKQVYLARDTRLHRDVVIALVRTGGLDPKRVTGLLREAQAMARLGDHPNIVTVYDIGEECGQPFIVSQYVEGGSVAELLKRMPEHRLPIERVIDVGSQVCSALANTHGNGIIHRDLKPANVWLTRDGTAKLGDFGLALGRDLSCVTGEGLLVGTAAYIAPERVMGRQADARSDLYSLGVMLYEMTTGRVPFPGDSVAGIISQHLNTVPVAPSWHNGGISEVMDRLILRLLAKAPDDRLQNASEVRDVLTTIALARPPQQTISRDLTSLARLAGNVFVGRENELARAREMLNEAGAGSGSLLLISGEPGSGKTRLADQFAVYASLFGFQSIASRCYEGEGAPPFWPWVQIVRAFAQEQDPADLAAMMGPGAADIAQVVPELHERIPNLAPAASLPPEQARFRFFDSMSTFVKEAAKRKPLVLILDDLHWADKPSLLLLQFLAQELRNTRIFVVGTFRDTDFWPRHPLALTLGELSRQGFSERIRLKGLTQADVARFIELTAGLRPPENLVRSVYQVTEGNPFFVNEVVSLLVTEGGFDRVDEIAPLAIRLPEGVREVVGRRLAHLSEECNRILTIASVLGREFSLNVLLALGEPSEQLLESLESAVAARIIAGSPGAMGLHTFTHALIRETLYEGISPSRRAAIHRKVGEALERISTNGDEPCLTELAHHFFQAASGGAADKAVTYAALAAQRETELLAYEKAVASLERGLYALDIRDQDRGEPDRALRCELLLSLGEAQTRAGIADKARENFIAAAAVARRLGDARKLARASLAIGAALPVGTYYGSVDQLHVSLLEEAIRALGHSDHALLSRLLAQLSLALYYSPERRARLSHQAVEMAQQVGDTDALIAALYSKCLALEGSNRTHERLQAADEVIRVAEAAGYKEMALRGYYRRFRDLMELGDIPAMEEVRKKYARLAGELRQPLYLWLAQFTKASSALLEGRFEDCERYAKEALSIGERAQDRNATLFFQTLMVTLRRTQGRAIEMLEGVESFVDKYPSIPAWRATLAQIYCETGRIERAREEFEKLAANDFAVIPCDGPWLVAMALLSQVCSRLKDAERAIVLYNAMRDFGGHNIVIGMAAVFYGPVSHYLGMLSAVLRRWDEAERHFESSLVAIWKVGCPPFVACTQFEYAAMLIARDRSGDRERASALLDASVATAEELGMANLAEEGRLLQSRVRCSPGC